MTIKSEQIPDNNNVTEIINKSHENINENEGENEDEINEESETNDEKSNESKKYGGKKKRELMDLSSQRLKRGRNNAYKSSNEKVNEDQINDIEEECNKETINVEIKKEPRKRAGRKKN